MIGPRLPHVITVFHPTGKDEWGAPTGTTTENVPARVEYRQMLIRLATGEQKPIRAIVETRHAVQVGDTITLPGETKGQTVLDVRRIDGLGGTESHREVYL